MCDNLKEKKVWLIGAGPIAIEYAKVLSEMEVSIDVIGRGSMSMNNFKEATGIGGFCGGYEAWLARKPKLPDAVIVAVNIEQLANTVIMLLHFGVKKILVEKPAGLNFEQIKRVAIETERHDAEVYVAYNRHFFASVQKARELIRKDGGVSSFNFEFTEWSHQIVKLEIEPEVRKNWFLANSTHVIDLAFFLGGRPQNITCYAAPGVDWHPASVYAGAGITKDGALFSYHANWAAPGRWGVEILTRSHRYILRPLEKLQIQNIGSVQTEYISIQDSLDQRFKPGFYRQVEAFLGQEKTSLTSIKDHITNLSSYELMNRVTNYELK